MFLVGSVRRFFPQKCVSDVQGHPRSLILVRIESVYVFIVLLLKTYFTSIMLIFVCRFPQLMLLFIEHLVILVARDVFVIYFLWYYTFLSVF